MAATPDFVSRLQKWLPARWFPTFFVLTSSGLEDDGGLITLATGTTGYPTSPNGLAAGAVWSNGGLVSIVPGSTPNPAAPPVYFGSVTAAGLLALGGGNLPTSSAGLAVGQLWNDGGVVAIASGAAIASSGAPPTRVYAQMASFASALSAVWSQIQYAIAQTRLSTSTDGWLDLLSADYFDDTLLRIAGETDAAYAARIAAAFPPRPPTRPSVIAVLTAFTGVAPRIVEPWRVADTGAWDAGVSYWDVDTQQNPARWGDASVRYQGFIITPLPLPVSGTNPVRTWDDTAYWDEANGYGGWFLDLPNSPQLAELYAVLQRVHLYGTIVWVQTTLLPSTPPPPPLGTVLTGDSGTTLLSDSGQPLTPP
jgi:hypothetical protein